MADIFISSPEGFWQPQDCRTGDILQQFQGNWTGSLILAETPQLLPTGRISVSYFGLTFLGSVLRSGTSRDGVCEVVVAGGAGGLWKALPALMHDGNPPVSLVLTGPQGILTATGETLSATSTASVLQQSLAQWPRRAGEAGYLLDDVVREVGAAWRVLPDGEVWVGVDEFEQAYRLDKDGRRVALAADVDYTSTRTGSRYLHQRVAPLSAFPARPGQSLAQGSPGGAAGGTAGGAGTGGASGAGGTSGTDSAVAATVGTAIPSPRISTVLHRYDGDHYVVDLWYLDETQPDAGGDDAVARGLRDIVGEATRHTLSYPAFHGTVVAQRGNGNLDIAMDGDSLPPLTDVRCAAPLPGSTLRVSGGARVQVQFLSGDPKQPMAVASYDQGAGTLVSLSVNLQGALTLVGTDSPTLVVTGDAQVSNDLAVGRDVTVTRNAVVGHVVGGGSAPTVVQGAACLTATLTRGHDAAMVVSFTPQAPPVPGLLFSVTFARAYAAAPAVVLTPSGGALTCFPNLSVSATTGGFTVSSGANVTSGALNCVVVG